MSDIVLEWLLSNKIEVLGAILGILYIVFSIKQNILTWPTGLLTSIFYIAVFYSSKFYADMGLQVYYVFISIYGWYYWLKGKQPGQKQYVAVKKTPTRLWVKLSISTVLIYFVILIILLKLTDSDVPYLDSLTTALSIVATWMLARKYIEHWIIWIFVDLLSSALYVYKNLWPTVILFIIYTVMAVFGYFEWKKNYNKN
jgi:nicotinamide mononucleotide transporter